MFNYSCCNAGGAGSCLQFLSQRVGGFAMGKVQKEGNSLQALQSGTLTLLYFALTHGDRSEHGIMDHGLALYISTFLCINSYSSKLYTLSTSCDHSIIQQVLVP